MLENYFEKFIFIEKNTVDDGVGGYTVEEVEAGEFTAGFAMANSNELLIAQQLGKKTQFHIITTDKQLKQHDRVKRVADGSIYRITSDSALKKAPSKTFKYMQANAERVEYARTDI